MKTSDLRKKSVAELEKDLISLREEQFKSQMKRSTGQLSHNHILKQARRDVARIKTVINELKRSKSN